MNVILLAPQGRSGSYFLQSLLDNHPQIVFLPFVFDYIKFFININRDNENIVNEFIELNPDVFTNEIFKPSFFSEHESKFIKKEIDKNKFKDNFLSMCSEKISSHKDFFELVHLAYAKTLGYDIDKIKYIFVHVHTIALSENDANIDFLIKNYPNLKFLITIRDFKEMMYSSLTWSRKFFIYGDEFSKYKFVYGTKFAKYKFIFFFRPVFYNLNSKIIYDIYEQKINDTLFVDLARLHLLQDKAMHKIAEFLGIEYLDCLTQSTIMGEAWLGNTIDGKIQSGFDIKKTTEKRADKLTYKELLLLRLFCFNTAKAFGYELESLNKIEKIYAWIYFIYLFIRPITAPLWQFEREELDKMTKEKIKDDFLKKIPLWLSKKIIFIKKKINRTKKFYRDYNISVWKKVIEIDKFFKDKIIDKDRFL